MQKILSAELVLCCSTLDLFVLQTFIKTMPREAKKRKSRSGTSKRAGKRTLQVGVQPETNENPRDKMLDKIQISPNFPEVYCR